MLEKNSGVVIIISKCVMVRVRVIAKNARLLSIHQGVQIFILRWPKHTLLFLPMSLVEPVETVRARDSIQTLNLRARSPHPPEPSTSAHHADSKSIEMVEMGPNVEGSNTPPGGSHATAKSTNYKAHIQFATLCWSLFMAGWNDGTTGPLLPRLQSVYHVRERGFS